MRHRSKFSSIIIAKPGTVLPPIPEPLRSHVFFEKVFGEYDGPPLKIDQYDEIYVYGAIAGFSPKGSIRLVTRETKDRITWITGKDVRQVYCIQNGHPKPAENRALCPQCLQTAGAPYDYKPLAEKPLVDNRVYFKCRNCGKVYWFYKQAQRKNTKKEPKSFDGAVVRKSTRPRTRTKRFA